MGRRMGEGRRGIGPRAAATALVASALAGAAAGQGGAAGRAGAGLPGALVLAALLAGAPGAAGIRCWVGFHLPGLGNSADFPAPTQMDCWNERGDGGLGDGTGCYYSESTGNSNWKFYTCSTDHMRVGCQELKKNPQAGSGKKPEGWGSDRQRMCGCKTAKQYRWDYCNRPASTEIKLEIDYKRLRAKNNEPF